MVLEVTRKLGQLGRGLLAATLVVGGLGCTGGPEESRQAQIQNQRMDWMDKQCQETTAAKEPVTVVRSQSPVTAPTNQTITPITNITAADADSARLQGEAQVRIVATIGTTPIYEREVREAVYQRLPELMAMSSHERKAKEQEMFKEELRRIVERELILDELFAMLNGKKQTSAMNQLKDGAAKDADNRLREIQKRTGQSDDDFKMFLQGQGLTISGVRRHFERSFMMSAYLGERLKPKMGGINLVDLKDYYDEHGDEFMTGDRVKWQDLFIRVDRFKSPTDAKKYTDWLVARAQRGEDFAKLINEFDMGDSKSRGGMGFGEEKGKIFPPEIEPTVFALKVGQVSIVEFESGFHIVRAAERTYAGKRPFDEQVQGEIRKKLQAMVSEREYRKIVDSLWRRNQPQILAN